jgi:hypothetical protein
LYKIDQNGLEYEEWSPVSNFEANNIIYNSLSKDIRNIYAVLTRVNDSVSLQFSDGTFGNLPVGTFRTYYRVSNGLSYTINTSDIRNVSISFPYISATGQTETLTLSLNLATSVSNAAVAETNAEIKANAPATFYTQNRMITGEDYNISPLSVTTAVAKVKAINRTSSGISRYFDIIDPTGKYSSTTLFADDGVIYKEKFINQTTFTYQTRTDINATIYNTVFDILEKKNLRNFYYSEFIKEVTNLNSTWNNVTSDSNSCTGYITTGGSVAPVGSITNQDLKYVSVGALINFLAPDSWYFDTNNSNNLVYNPNNKVGMVNNLWAEVVNVADNGLGIKDPLTDLNTGIRSTGFGAITLNQVIPSLTGYNPIITRVIPKWKTVIDSSTIATMIDLIFANKPFGLRYDRENQKWQIVFEANLDTVSLFSLAKTGDSSRQQQDASWLILFTTDNVTYTITSREQRYVFESDKQIRFYFDKSKKVFDSRTDSIVKDQINVLSINLSPDNSGSSFTVDHLWDVDSEFIGLDGYVDTKKLVITFADSDDDGVVDDPEIFTNIVINPSTLLHTYVVLEKYQITTGQDDYRYFDNSNNTVIIKSSQNAVSLNEKVNGQYFYFEDTNVVKQYDNTTGTFIVTLDYKVFVGRDKLKFQYSHSADYDSRIDAGASNIIDVYVLTKTYDTNYRQWVSGAILTEPLPPGNDELYDTLSPNLNLIKSISDEIIYHPVRYKVLFGSSAKPELQATFKVVKNPSRVVSDNDIKSRIVAAMNQFFSLDSWDFGDTFYFTELSAYVVNQLSPDITSFVIVPKQSGLGFGGLFEIQSNSDELFISSATVSDIEIISSITASNIKAVAGTTTISNVTSQQTITSSTYGSN